ncbi:hypothetical protein [Candidatus Amarolinea aalborgensis]|jgi:hypothetical protein|uniref:hypothetical protein n=1 Tax=Candidatus Amarolinea aalborgensis TaxID=2249329 RepID=UPI003BFA32FC
MLNHDLHTGRLMRLLWAVTVVVFTALYLLALPQSVAKAQQDPMAWLDIALQAIYLLLAWFVFWQRSADSVAYIFSLILLMALTGDRFQVVFAASTTAQSLDLIFAALSSTLLIWLFYVFPDGRFVPRWTRWAAVAVAAVQLGRIFFEEAYMARGFPVMGLFMLTGAFAQVCRYRSISDPIQRQQIKWVVFGLAITLVPMGVILAAVGIFGLDLFEGNSAAETLGLLVWIGFLIVFPLSIVVSILRYRLWDIDVVIRKTLVYTVLTALLALVYVGSVILLQGLVGTLTGVEQSTLAVVVSTLAIAAIFTPLRRRIQDVIDRRFYRKKYDAQQVLAQFALTAQDETDLDALTGELARVVQETLQPEQVSVWLRKK